MEALYRVVKANAEKEMRTRPAKALEYHRIMRRTRLAATCCIALVALGFGGCGGIGEIVMYTPNAIWQERDHAADAAAKRILILAYDQIGGRTARDGSWTVAVTSGMQHQLKRLLLTKNFRDKHGCESLASMTSFYASADVSYDWVEWRKDFERTQELHMGWYCGSNYHSMLIDEDGAVRMSWREEK